ncbi:MAG TPA: BamA/TamA family outer membrane protein [Longimicrobiales bacterium]|nr:BamA/TamA family outer membrane protein [Longimicrobiales bacterium]
MIQGNGRRFITTFALAFPAACAFLAVPAAARAQDEALAQLPDSIALRVIAFYNAPTTTRLAGGGTHITTGTSIGGPVAVLGGPFALAGTIGGDLVVINGDVQLERGARVDGTLTVVGGTVSGIELATIAGGVSHHREPLRFRQDAGGMVYAPPAAEAELSAGRDFGFGRTDILVAARRDYNRVEGLPISFGPRVRIGRSNPTLFHALAIYRSSAGLRIDPDQMGYAIRVEQFLGGGNTARLGLRLFSEITPIEDTGITNRENSLSTFVLHDDYRDAYELEGWAAFVRFARSGWPHDLTIEYREEKHRSVATANPWSLFNNAEPWRPQPLVAEGTWRGVTASFVYDTRNDDTDPAAGWHIMVEAEQGTGGNLRIPAATALPGDSTVGPFGVRERFTSTSFDIRRYFRIGPGTKLSVRGFAAGSIDGSSLPAQRQHTIGGEGGLPGYGLHRFDCSARRSQVEYRDEAFFPWYGCDRVALGQIELQSDFPLLSRQTDAIGNALGVQSGARWVAFFDIGRAWNEADALAGRGGGRRTFATDAGLGIRIGGLGFYWAYPMSGAERGINFFVRLGRRL